MRLSRVKIASAVALIGAVGVTAAAVAGGRSSFETDLSGYEEVPATISTGGSGTFEARLNRSGTELKWRLHYEDLEGAVQQAHIHFGARRLANGISVFLCSNLGNGPAGTQACPAPPATIEGTATAADVIGPANQGIAAGELGELLRAMRAGVTYANVHTALYPTGEVRGQIDSDRGRHGGH
jgi:hypothetical protein